MIDEEGKCFIKNCEFLRELNMTGLKVDHRCAAAIAFFTPAIIFFVFRIHLFPVFNSDPFFIIGAQNIDISTAFSSKFNFMHFRPLSVFLEMKIGYLYQAYGEQYHTIVVSIVAFLHGLLSLLIYKICFTYSKSSLTSLLALFLYTFSTASIDATWHNLFSAFMLGPLLTICGAIFAYMRFREVIGWTRWIWLSIFVLLCLISPWFREFGYIPATTVLVIELWQFPKTRSFFFLVPAILSAHAVIPKALASVCGLYDDPVELVFMGRTIKNICTPYVSKVSVIESACNVISAIVDRSNVGFIINEFPLLLWMCIIPIVAYSTVAISPCLFRREYWSAHLRPQGTTGLGRINPKPSITCAAHWIATIAIFCLLAFLLRPIFEGNRGIISEKFRLLGFLIFLAFLSSLRFGILFPVWFIVTLPAVMFIGSNHEIHTSFVTLPMAMICALYCRDIARYLSGIRLLLLRHILVILIALAFILIIFDHSSNVGTSFIALQNLNTGHQRIGRWISDNVQAGSVVFTDFFAARDIIYRTSFPDSKYVFQPIHYEWIEGNPNTPQLDIIRKAVDQKHKVFYVHLKTYSADLYLPLPIDFVRKLATFEIDNTTFSIDPLRLAVDRRRYLRRFTPSEWDTSYGWVGYGANRFIWRAEVEIYELIETDIAKLGLSSFKDAKRYSFPPKEAGDNSVIEWNNPYAWTNNTDTSIVPYEKFSSAGPDNIAQAVNTARFGIANTPSFEVTAGKWYEITFNMLKRSGVYPTIRISEDPYGNTSFVNYTTADGKRKYTFKADTTRHYFAVFRVEDCETSDFSVNAFSLKEVTPEAQVTGELKPIAKINNDVPTTPPAGDIPELIIDGYKDTNYNIIYYQGKYYGLFRGEGAFLFEKVKNGQYKTPVFISDSLDHIKKIIDEQIK